MLITNILGSLDRKIEICNKKIVYNQSFIENLYYQWFVDFEFPNEEGKPYKANNGSMVWNNYFKRYIPKYWVVDTIGKHVTFEKGISYTTDDIVSGIGIPMINLASIDILRNYKPSELKYYSGSFSNKKLAYPGELLIACTDLTRNADIIGSPIIVPYKLDKKYLYSMDMVKIIANETIDNFYLYMSLRTDYYHKYIKGFASGTTVLHLDIDGIKWYTLWLPPRTLQDKFAEIIKPLQQEIGKLYKEIEVLKSIKNTLLPLLINGQAHLL